MEFLYRQGERAAAEEDALREVLRKVSPDGQAVNLMKGKDGKVYAVLANAGDPGASVVFPVYWGKGGMPCIGKGRVMNNAELDPSTLESVPVESLLKLQRTGRASLDEQESEALRARDTQEALPPIGDDTMLEVSEAFTYVNEKGKQAAVPQGSIIHPLKGYVMSEDGNSLVPCMVYRGKEDATGKLQNIPQGVLQAKVQEGILAGRPVSAEDYAQVGADADADMDETTDESADAAGKSAPEGTGSVRAADSGEARPEDGERDVERPGNPDGEAEPEAPSGSGESSSGGPGVPEAEAFASRFRENFHEEPGTIANRAFDMVLYFIPLVDAERRALLQELPDRPGNGLFTRFRFQRAGEGMSLENRGLYMVNYRFDYTIVVAPVR